MSLAPDLLLRSPEEAARRIALSFLDEAHAASRRLDDPKDKEALHDFRVGIRRLRSTLRAWRDRLEGTISKKQRKALKALQNATGGGRDAEVAIEWLAAQRGDLRPVHRYGQKWMVDRLAQRRDDAMSHVCSQVRQDFDAIEDDLRARLRRLRIEVELDAPHGGETFAEALAQKCREHTHDLVLHLTHVASLDDREEAHEARITGKRLRYLLEPIRREVPEAAALVKRMKGLQDLLGELNDAHVLDEELRAALEEAAVAHVRELHQLLSRADEEGVRRHLRRNERTGLIELTRRGQQRAQDLFAKLQGKWLEEGAAALLGQAEALAVLLERRAHRGHEVERKYLLKRLPELPEEATPVEIDQGWLPGKELQERLRRTSDADGEHFTRTVKTGTGLVRTELEEPASRELFEALWPYTEGKRVTKRRWRVPDGDRVWEIDEFLDRKLYLAEVELDGPHDEVEIPAWLEPVLHEEVTGSAKYVNVNLAR